VLSGADLLADGLLHLKLQDGRLHLDPAVLNLPGGRMRLAGSYDVKGTEVECAVGAQIERFDCGIIARRLGRADDVDGLFSLNLDLEGKAPALATIMRKANGKLNLAVWPVDLSLGVFNLWSVNLVLSVLPLIDPGGNAWVNCVVGRFDLRDGILTDDRFLIDTTRVRVSGSGQADLGSEELAFVFPPARRGPGPVPAADAAARQRHADRPALRYHPARPGRVDVAPDRVTHPAAVAGARRPPDRAGGKTAVAAAAAAAAPTD